MPSKHQQRDKTDEHPDPESEVGYGEESSMMDTQEHTTTKSKDFFFLKKETIDELNNGSEAEIMQYSKECAHDSLLPVFLLAVRFSCMVFPATPLSRQSITVRSSGSLEPFKEDASESGDEGTQAALFSH